MTWLVLLALSTWASDPRPPLEDAERLPDLKTLNVGIDQAHAYYRELNSRVDANTPAVQAAMTELLALQHWLSRARTARECLDAIAQGIHLTNDTECGRNALHELRTMMGYSAYYAGAWPPPLPWWRLPRHS